MKIKNRGRSPFTKGKCMSNVRYIDVSQLNGVSKVHRSTIKWNKKPVKMED